MRCTIKWIDCSCKPTPDENEAVGWAIQGHGVGEKRFPICADHLSTLQDRRSHHSPTTGCPHGVGTPTWRFEPFESKP